MIGKTDKIFVAGHNGMVGSAIVRCLRKRGYENLLLANRQDLDLRVQSDVGSFLDSNAPDAVILAAAKVGGILANRDYPGDFILENLQIQTNVIGEAFSRGISKLLFLGSSCIYPKHADQPITEEELLTGPLEETNEAYAIAKIAGLKLCAFLSSQHGVDYRSVMPTNLYGPGDNFHPEKSHVVPALLRRFHEAKEAGSSSVTVWGSGKPRREFLFVDDMAEACLHVLEIDKEDFESVAGSSRFINVGTGTDVSIQQLAKTVSDVVGFEGTIAWDTSKPDGTPRKLLNVDKIKTLGWNPEVELVEGLTRTLNWYTQAVDA